MVRRPPSSTRTDTLSPHDALPICEGCILSAMIILQIHFDYRAFVIQAKGHSPVSCNRHRPASLPVTCQLMQSEIRWHRQFLEAFRSIDESKHFAQPPSISNQAFSVARLEETTQAFRSEEHTSELQSLMRNSYAVFCLQKTHHN